MWAYTILLLTGLFILVAVARRRRSERRARAATTSLSIDDSGVRRTLADGRSEGAQWVRIVEVEVVCTPVPTADGARQFVLLAEAADAGCLVPLGIGYDEPLITGLLRLPGFRLEEFASARGQRAPSRVTCWRRVSPRQEEPTA